MPPNQQRGTGFINLQQYLGLNQGAANSMGNALADDVDNRWGDINREFSGGMERFNSAVSAGTPGAGRAGPGQYTGPTSLGNYLNKDALQAKGAEAATRGLAGGTNEGRATLLKDKYGANTWGGGALDGALAGASSAGGRLGSQARDAKYGFASLQRYLGGADAAAADRVKGAQMKTQAHNEQVAAGQQANEARQQEPAPEENNPRERRQGRNPRYTYP